MIMILWKIPRMIDWCVRFVIFLVARRYSLNAVAMPSANVVWIKLSPSLQLLHVDKVCPIYRKDPFIAYPQLEADRSIKELKVYCPNMKDGCEWIGELSKIVDHKPGQKCERCDKCQVIVHYSDMHLNCPCHCPHCNVTASREKISSEHKEKCHKFPMSCPNNCGQENIARDDIDEHRKACPLEMIECEYCEDRITRNEVKKHNKKNIILPPPYCNIISYLSNANSTTLAVILYYCYHSSQP